MYHKKNSDYGYINKAITERNQDPKLKTSADYLAKIDRIRRQIKALEEAEKKALSKIKAQQKQILDDAIQKISALNQEKTEIQRKTAKSIF